MADFILHLEGDVYGRSTDLAAIERFLDALGRGPAALVFEGDPGIGKTTLLRAAVESARRRDLGVLAYGAGTSETRLSYAALAELLAGIDADVTRGLPLPQRRALNGALLRDDGASADPDPRAVATAVLSLFERLAEARPLVVAVDDLQWVDGASARVLEFCARRLAGRVGLVVSRRTCEREGKVGGEIRLREPERMDVCRITPLDVEALRALLRQRLGRPPARRTLERIHEASGGNPFYAVELARTLRADGPAPPALPLPASLKEVIEARLAGLGDHVDEVLLAVAALAEPTVELVVQALGPDAEDELGEAEDRGMLERDGRRLRFAHPLLANGILARASSAERREIHRRLSAVVPDVEERARHLAYAGDAPEALRALDDAARVVRARGAPAAAAELLELAIGLGGGNELRVRAAEHHLDAGDSARAQVLLGQAIPWLPAGEARAHALLLLAELRYHDDSYPQARSLLERAKAEEGVSDRLRVMVDLRLAFVLANLGRVIDAEAPAQSALEVAERLGDDALRAQALAVSAAVDFALGRGLNGSRLDRALTLEDSDVRMASVLRPSLVAGLLYLSVARFDEARRLLSVVCDRHAERGEEHELGWASFGLVWIECLSGNIAAATKAADEALERLLQLETPNRRAIGLAARAQVDVYAGRADEARRGATLALELFTRSGWRTAALRAQATLGLLDLSLGDYEAAADRLGPVALHAASNGIAASTWGGALSYGDAAEALVEVGRIDEAEEIAALLERRSAGPAGSWPRGLGSRCRALILAARGDVAAAEDTLERALTAHECLSIPLERGRGLLALGRIQRRRRKRVAAKATLEQALEIFESIGSPLWAAQARAELDRIPVPVSAPDGLTEIEERIADLAAAGLTNREVAQTLHVSPKTVELYLGRAYRKLGIRSRAELGAHMARRRVDTHADESRRAA